MNKLRKQFEEKTGKKVFKKIFYVKSQLSGWLYCGRKVNENYMRSLEFQLTWKSVEDELPKHGTGYVLARHKLDKPFVALYRRNISEWFEWSDVENIFIRNPTHWLLIPKN